MDVVISVIAGGLRSNLGSLFLRRNVLILVYIKGMLIGAAIIVFTELFISIDRDDNDIYSFCFEPILTESVGELRLVIAILY